jgi:arabinose-5-phosphate isomerase
MTTKLLGSTAVVDANNKLLGIITDGDLRRALMHNSNLNNLTAANLMTPNPKTLLPQTLAITAWETLRQHKITQIVVADEQNNYLGIVHIHNLAREGFI